MAVKRRASQCTFLVLGAFRRVDEQADGGDVWSQCTFWCLVLSDRRDRCRERRGRQSLNAPSGAWCFPTVRESRPQRCGNVSMHLLVLGASRRPNKRISGRAPPSLNAPSGAWCFPTPDEALRNEVAELVSMHLLVLGAFRQTAGV